MYRKWASILSSSSSISCEEIRNERRNQMLQGKYQFQFTYRRYSFKVLLGWLFISILIPDQFVNDGQLVWSQLSYVLRFVFQQKLLGKQLVHGVWRRIAFHQLWQYFRFEGILWWFRGTTAAVDRGRSSTNEATVASWTRLVFVLLCLLLFSLDSTLIFWYDTFGSHTHSQTFLQATLLALTSHVHVHFTSVSKFTTINSILCYTTTEKTWTRRIKSLVQVGTFETRWICIEFVSNQLTHLCTLHKLKHYNDIPRHDHRIRGTTLPVVVAQDLSLTFSHPCHSCEGPCCSDHLFPFCHWDCKPHNWGRAKRNH